MNVSDKLLHNIYKHLDNLIISVRIFSSSIIYIKDKIICYGNEKDVRKICYHLDDCLG